MQPFSKGFLDPPVFRLRRSVVFAPPRFIPCSEHRWFHLQLQGLLARIFYAAVGTLAPMLCSQFVDAFVLASYGNAVLSCAVFGFIRSGCVVLGCGAVSSVRWCCALQFFWAVERLHLKCSHPLRILISMLLAEAVPYQILYPLRPAVLLPTWRAVCPALLFRDGPKDDKMKLDLELLFATSLVKVPLLLGVVRWPVSLPFLVSPFRFWAAFELINPCDV